MTEPIKISRRTKEAKQQVARRAHHSRHATLSGVIATLPGRQVKPCPVETRTQMIYIVGRYGETKTVALAKSLGVTATKIENWKRYDPDYRFAFLQARDNFFAGRLEKSLIQIACGYQYEEIKNEDVSISGKTPDGMRVYIPGHKTTTYKKQFAPQVNAIIFYLVNRAPDRWKHVLRGEEPAVPINHFVNQNISMDLSKLKREELETLRNIIRRAGSGEVSEGNTSGAT